MAINIMLLGFKIYFLELAGVGPFKVRGLFAATEGTCASSGDRAIGEGAAAGGDWITVVLKGFPPFLQGNTGITNLKKRAGNKAKNLFVLMPHAKQLSQK